MAITRNAEIKQSYAQGMSQSQGKAIDRKSLNGLWLLDKGKGPYSMRGYLEAMAISEEIIQLHEKKEMEKDAAFEISLTEKQYTIKHFYWQDFESKSKGKVLQLELGEEVVESIKVYGVPTQLRRQTVARSSGQTHICVTRRMITANGYANIKDVKVLIEPRVFNGSTGSYVRDKTKYPIMRHELTIVNESLNKEDKMVRFFMPIDR